MTKLIEALNDCSQLTLDNLKSKRYISIEKGEWSDFEYADDELSNIIEQLKTIATSRCQLATKNRFSHILSRNIAFMPHWARDRFYLELVHGSIIKVNYITGQEYTSEMREIRRNVLKGY